MVLLVEGGQVILRNEKHGAADCARVMTPSTQPPVTDVSGMNVKRPNIVVVVTDEYRGDILGHIVNPVVVTRNADEPVGFVIIRKDNYGSNESGLQ